MGEFNKDQGQGDQSGQQTDKPAFGQFDKEQGQQQDQEFGQQGKEEFAGAEGGKEFGAEGGQTGMGGKPGQQEQDEVGLQQGDNQYQNEKNQGDNQNR